MRKLKRILKGNPLVRSVYYKLKETIVDGNNAFDVPEVLEIAFRPDNQNSRLRINLLLPSIDVKHVFGGIATAIKFFEVLGETLNCDMRIIITDSTVDFETSVKLDNYKIVSSDAISSERKQIVPYADRYQKTLAVAKNDVFVATGWWTAYILADIMRAQSEYFSTNLKPLIYLIQDFEPGFYGWSSRYLMADSTYKLDIPTIAVFNSYLLKEYFNNNQYVFYKEFCFEPKLNKELKQYLKSKSKDIVRKNQILIYGRPSTQRNAFELIVSSLKKWAVKYDRSSDWNIISLGEKHEDIPLGNGKNIISKGKVSLENYAELMLETKIGISLMVSPHPSYPPLEMSTFGIKTITNTYANKNISSFNQNIISLDNCSQSNICGFLQTLCEDINLSNQIQINNSYMDEMSAFDDISEEINNILKTLTIY